MAKANVGLAVPAAIVATLCGSSGAFPPPFGPSWTRFHFRECEPQRPTGCDHLVFLGRQHDVMIEEPPFDIQTTVTYGS
jgi:hypothetical protein